MNLSTNINKIKSSVKHTDPLVDVCNVLAKLGNIMAQQEKQIKDQGTEILKLQERVYQLEKLILEQK